MDNNTSLNNNYDDDEEDLYGDLNETTLLAASATSSSSSSNNKKQKKMKITSGTSLTSDIASSSMSLDHALRNEKQYQEEIKSLKNENLTLKRNIGILYRTAKVELDRKNMKIQELEKKVFELTHNNFQNNNF